MPDIWYALTDTSKYVYHYTTAKIALRYILKNQSLKFGQLRSVNDPREFNSWSFQITNFDLSSAEANAIVGSANDFLKDKCNLCCFVTDVDASAQNAQTRNPLPSMFERGHSRPRMWAQYGDNHAGVCLVFDRRKLDLSFNGWSSIHNIKLHGGRVRYAGPAELDPSKTLPAFTLAYDRIKLLGIATALSQHLKTHFETFFFTKLDDWKQEREYRWLLFCDDSSDKYLPFSDALVGVAIGEKFTDKNRIELGKLLLTKEVDIAEICWRNGFPQPSPLHPRPLSKGQNPMRTSSQQ